MARKIRTHTRTRHLGAALLLSSVAGLGVGVGTAQSAGAASYPCGLSFIDKNPVRGPFGFRAQYVAVRNCHPYTVKRRVAVNNFPDDTCETYRAGQTKVLDVALGSFGGHGGHGATAPGAATPPETPPTLVLDLFCCTSMVSCPPA